MLPILKEQFEIRKNKVLDLIESYAKEYAQDLSNLQPYMIERRKDQEKQESFICVVDNMYRISVYIKADNSFGDEMI